MKDASTDPTGKVYLWPMTTNDYQGLKYQSGKLEEVEDTLTAEASIQIMINKEPYTVTMRTPGNDRELVRGLLHNEDLFKYAKEALEYEVVETDDNGDPLSVNVNIPEDKLGKGYINSRNILSVSSCGICGKRELDDLKVDGDPLPVEEQIDPRTLALMFEAMRAGQNTFEASGGSHASAAFTLNGKLLILMEDIGRHNAVDKVVGGLIESGQLNEARCLLVSGRISYEIVTKAFMAGIPVLAAVSAPSTLAVDFAKELGITLLAFCRDGKATCYANVQRLQQ